MKTIKFEDIDWSKIQKDTVSMSFTLGKGLSVILWENKVGSANNKIIGESFLPEALHRATYNYVNERCNRSIYPD